MLTDLNYEKTTRKTFARIGDFIEMPNLIKVQKKLKELGFFIRQSKWKVWGRNRKSHTKILQRKQIIFKKNNRYRITKTYGL